ncbi:MAG: M48 family metallopeptidase [Ruminococcus sp.]|nr:M48 family metallopeptidase [Ruminococcus sp.]
MNVRNDYTLIRSRRKTISLEMRPDGSLVVRAPVRTTNREADEFVKKHEKWIETHRKKMEERRVQAQKVKQLTDGELKALLRLAKKVIPERVAYYAGRMGAQYGRITLRCQKTRWGSCSAKKNLNFNILLMLAPVEALDSVIVHELCHLFEMNHGERFYQRVYAVYPDYDRWNRWLKEHGPELLARAGLRS